MSIKKDIYALLEEAYNLYKENFSDFILFGIAQSLIGIISIYVLNMISKDMIILYLPISLVLFYIDMRLAATFVLLANDRCQNIHAAIPDYYDKSKRKIWEYIGATLMLVFIGVIVIGIAAAVFYFSDDPSVNILFVLVRGGAALYVISHYFLAPIIILLDQESEAAFKESRILIKPIRLLALAVLFVSILLTKTPSLLLKLVVLPGIVNSFIEITTNALLTPLSLSFVIIFYHKLTNHKVEPEQDVN